MGPFFQGVLAGYGIAIPVGAIAVLIIEIGLRQGFWAAFAAGAGASTADLCYAVLAAAAGQALSAALAPYAGALRAASALVLVGMGAWGLIRALRAGGMIAAPGAAPQADSHTAIYARFVGLTLLNPLTMTYFAALILGGSSTLTGWTARLAFVSGAGLASLSWQTFLAALCALGHRHLSTGTQRASSLLGNLIVIGLGLRLFF